jgi:hypothetical protein
MRTLRGFAASRGKCSDRGRGQAARVLAEDFEAVFAAGELTAWTAMM